MTIQQQGGYLQSSGIDHEGIHVEFYDGCRHQHFLFDSEQEANRFINSEFPKNESGCVGFSGFGANTHAPSYN